MVDKGGADWKQSYCFRLLFVLIMGQRLISSIAKMDNYETNVYRVFAVVETYLAFKIGVVVVQIKV